jgi:serine/threonine protein kinase
MRLILKASGISKEETQSNPQAVLDVLNFHMEGPAPPPLPSTANVVHEITDAVMMKSGSYTAHYTDLVKLGQGASGIVYSATRKSTGQKVALKIAAAAELNDLTNEMGIQSMSKHENIVEIIEAYHSGDVVCIVMELVIGCMLTDVLGTKISFPERCVAYVCREVLKALDYMHRNHRLHRDIKSDNILVSTFIFLLLLCLLTNVTCVIHTGWSRWGMQSSRFWIRCKSYTRTVEEIFCCWYSLLDGTRVD